MSFLQKEKDFFKTLKTELAIKNNNEYVGSGLGGNISELFFLFTHKVNIGKSPDYKIHFNIVKDNIVCLVPHKPNLKDARKELTNFINNHLDKVNVIEQQLLNISFLKDLEGSTLDIKLLIHAIEVADILVNYLDSKIELKKHIDNLFSKEHAALESSFLKEINLPISYLEDLRKDSHKTYDINAYSGVTTASEETDNPISDMFYSHPIWGVKDKAVSKRHSEMNERLLSQEDLDKLNFIGTLPSYITLFVVRTKLGMERIVTLSLDERDGGFLNIINNNLDNKKYI